MIKTRFDLFRVLSFAAVLSLVGCASQPSVPDADKGSPEASGKHVVLLDEDMDHYIAVDSLISTRNANGYLEVQANIRNRTERDFTIQAQTLFFDKNGLVLNSDSGNEAPWMTLPLTSNATVPYHCQALSPNANGYTIRLRYLGRKSF